MKRPIAVIGGTGSAARLLTRDLTARGETIRAIGRSTLRAHRHLPPQAQYFLADLRRPEQDLAEACVEAVYRPTV
ncbi:hypothetical protein ABZ446_08165 [Streptomyces sp. NPDC005813]|uniref:hypothetical protein n=1 Tax=Streptomyces sp. NPDC005813 TaxID=3155592 RepID=UPI0033F17E56